MQPLVYLYLFIYTSPAQQFTQDINNTNSEVKLRLTVAGGLDLAPYNLNLKVSGKEVLNLIQDSKAGKIAVLVSGRTADVALVNYGYQLRRPAVSDFPSPGHTYTRSQNGSSYSGTEFEKNFVSVLQYNLYGYSPTNNPAGRILSIEDYRGLTGAAATPDLLLGRTNGVPKDVLSLPNIADPAVQHNGSLSPGISENLLATVAFYDYRITPKQAHDKGRTFGSTGHLYTNNVIHTNMQVNTNMSYANDPNSPYHIHPQSSFYSALIVNNNDEIVGVFLEEHGKRKVFSAMANVMLDQGIINITN